MADYFALERSSDVRHEFLDGEILAMAGETPVHNRIAKNICILLDARFGDRRYDVFIEGIRTRVTETRYRYPDIAALCGEALFDKERPPSLLNPSVIFEVLSPSTEDVDSGVKFEEYRRLDTVTDYVTVAQDRVEVAHYARQSTHRWTVTIHEAIGDTIALAALDVTITLGDIYRKIDFSAPTAASPAPPAE
ncbi:MAG TPA: Uma2 family endonuclease [Chthonomonadaceae bacterium]|nr:Uma2 family endonuclease [Chthonomonadaceae bacterium]